MKQIASTDRQIFVTNTEVSLLHKKLMEMNEASVKNKELERRLFEQMNNLTKEVENCKKVVESKESERLGIEDQLSSEDKKKIDMEIENEDYKSKLEECIILHQKAENDFVRSKDNEQSLSQALNNSKNVLQTLKSKIVIQDEENIDLSKNIERKENDLLRLNEENILSSEQVSIRKEVLKESEDRIKQLQSEIRKWKLLADDAKIELDDKVECFEKLDSDRSVLTTNIAEMNSRIEETMCSLDDLNEIWRKMFENDDVISNESDGWELEDDCLLSVEKEALEEEAKLRVKLRRSREEEEELSLKVSELDKELCLLNQEKKDLSKQIQDFSEKKVGELKCQDNAEKKLIQIQEKFKQREVYLVEQLDACKSQCEYIKSQADIKTKQLSSVTNALAISKKQLLDLKNELEDQESSYKSAILIAESKAQENWIASRQFSRKVQDLQRELTSLRKKLTEAEGKKENVVSLLRSEEDIVNASEIDQLPPLPGMPKTIVQPSMPLIGMPNKFLPNVVPGLALPPLPGMSALPGVPSFCDSSNLSLGNLHDRSGYEMCDRNTEKLEYPSCESFRFSDREERWSDNSDVLSPTEKYDYSLSGSRWIR